MHDKNKCEIIPPVPFGDLYNKALITCTIPNLDESGEVVLLQPDPCLNANGEEIRPPPWSEYRAPEGLVSLREQPLL